MFCYLKQNNFYKTKNLPNFKRERTCYNGGDESLFLCDDGVRFNGGLGELFGVSNESLTGKVFTLHSKAKKCPRKLDANPYNFMIDFFNPELVKYQTWKEWD